MKNLHLTLLAAACSIAFSGCSSNNSGSSHIKTPVQISQQKDQKAEEKKKVEKARLAEEAKKAEEMKKAEDARLAEAKKAEEMKKAEDARLAEEAKKAEEMKKAEDARLAEEAKKAEEMKKAEDARLAEEAKKAEEMKKAEDARLAEEVKKAEEMKKAEDARLAEEAKKAEEMKKSEDARLAEAKKAEEMKKAEEDRLVERARIKKIEQDINTSFVYNGTDSNNIAKLSGVSMRAEQNQISFKNIDHSKNNNIHQLVVDGINVTLFSDQFITDNIDNGITQDYDAVIDEKTGYQKRKITTKAIQETVNGKTVIGQVGELSTSRSKNDFNQIKYGYVTVDNATTLFVQGFMTPKAGQDGTKSPYNHYSYLNDPTSNETLREMPTEGKFKYYGHAFYGNNNQYGTYDVEAIADIDNKKVKVDIKNGEQNVLTFGGKITDNTFAGKYENTVAKGAFYGTNAWDIGGTFYNVAGEQKDKHGVFGASQGNSWSGNQVETSLTDFNVK